MRVSGGNVAKITLYPLLPPSLKVTLPKIVFKLATLMRVTNSAEGGAVRRRGRRRRGRKEEKEKEEEEKEEDRRKVGGGSV